jgi:hypothetical protein
VNEIVLTESRAARSENAGNVGALGRVKALGLLPDDLHVTTEMVAAYYDVPGDSISSVVRRHRDELTENGLRVLRGDELREFKSSDVQDEHHWDRTSTLILFTRRTVLNVGMLLVDSEVARAVRRELLNRYEATPAAPELSLDEVLRRIKVLDAARKAGGVRAADVGKRVREMLVPHGLADPLPADEERQTQAALSWVRRRRQPGETFSPREMFHGLHGQAWVDGVTDVHDVIPRLVEAGHVRPVPRPAVPLRGRPPGPRYEVLAEPGHLALVRDGAHSGGAS